MLVGAGPDADIRTERTIREVEREKKKYFLSPISVYIGANQSENLKKKH